MKVVSNAPFYENENVRLDFQILEMVCEEMLIEITQFPR